MSLPKRTWGDEICGLHAHMMRSDGRWYHVLIEKFDKKDGVHLVTFFAQGKATENKAEYDLRDPLRRIRFFDENGALMAEGKGPILGINTKFYDGTGKSRRSSGAPIPPPHRAERSNTKSLALVTVDVSSLEANTVSAAMDALSSVTRMVVDVNPSLSLTGITLEDDKKEEDEEEKDEEGDGKDEGEIISKNFSFSSSASNYGNTSELSNLQGDVLYLDSATGHAFTMIDRESVPVYLPPAHHSSSSNTRSTRPTPLEPPPGGWPLLQQQSRDPLHLMFKQVRLYWPVDNEWFSGRILDWDVKTDEYFIRYDDGDERWYDLKEREYTLVDECGPELVGRRLAIQFQKDTTKTKTSTKEKDKETTNHHAHSNNHETLTKKQKQLLDSTNEPPRFVWRFAEVVDYRPKLDMHVVAFKPLLPSTEDDGTHQRTLSLSSFSSAVRSDELVLKLTTRPFFLLADPDSLREKDSKTLIGKRVLVIDKVTGDLDSGVITNVTEPINSSSSSSAAATSYPASSSSSSSIIATSKPTLNSILRVIFDSGEVLNGPWHSIFFSFRESDAIEGTPKVAGGVGLLNMGNTCYLNSVLQSLSHIDALTKFFFSPSFFSHLNTTSKQGLQGRMATAMHELLKTLWGKDVLALTPSLVKALLSERSPQFNGMGQQDAQESLLCLLDALHEDLAEPDPAASAAAQKDAVDAANEEAKDKKLQEQKLRMKNGASSGTAITTTTTTSTGWGSLLSGVGKKKAISAHGVTSEEKTSGEGGQAVTSARGSSSTSSSSSSSSSTSQPTERSFLETTSIIKRLFFVQTHVEFVCQRNSRHVHYRHGPRGGELLPPLSLAPQKEIFEGWMRKKVVKQPSLIDCISNYFTDETVERHCDQCARTVSMTSRPWLKALPPVLVIHLKRFEYKEVPSLGHSDRSEWTNVKLTTPIPFPLRGLDMSPFVSKMKERASNKNTVLSTGSSISPSSSSSTSSPTSSTSSSSSTVSGSGSLSTINPSLYKTTSSSTSTASSFSTTSSTSSSARDPLLDNSESSIYDLFSVVCHVGSAEQGHYTAFNRSSENGDWCYYDDSVVVPALESEVSSEIAASLAYLLFYAKRPVGALPPALSPAAAERERLFQNKAKENMAKVLSANPLTSSLSSSFASSNRNGGGGIVGGISANLSLLLTGSTNTLASTWGSQGGGGVGAGGGGGNGIFSSIIEPHHREHSHLSKSTANSRPGKDHSVIAPLTGHTEAVNGFSMAFANLPNH
jgi:ubiquitin C-terminal hydrolase